MPTPNLFARTAINSLWRCLRSIADIPNSRSVNWRPVSRAGVVVFVTPSRSGDGAVFNSWIIVDVMIYQSMEFKDCHRASDAKHASCQV
jgi:hypothetical protein